MKLNLATILIVACTLLSCGNTSTAQNFKSLNAQAQKEYAIPIRPGYEGRNPYWNEYAKRFIYAPAFDFKKVDSAQKYLYRVEAKDGSIHEFKANEPGLALSPIWNDIPVGNVKLTVEALDASGKSLGITGEREFYRDFPFKGPYHSAVRSYKETAVKALLYLHHLKPILKFENSLEPDMSFWQFSYPCKTISAIIRCELMLTNYSPKQGPQAYKIAINCGDFMIQNSQPADAPLAYFPPTYYGDQKAAGKEINRGKTMSMEAAKAAMAFLDLYDYSSEQRFYDQALGIARTYAKIQRPDGSIPMKLIVETGEAVNEVNARLHPVLYVFKRFHDQYKVEEFEPARKLAEQWMNTEAFNKFEMIGQFEDTRMEDMKPYENLSHWTGVPYITYVLSKGEKLSDEMLDLAKDVIRFGEDQFTIWDTEVNEDGIHYFDTPSATEQYHYWVPVDDSAADMATAFLHLYQATGDKLAFAKAKALFDEMTIIQHSNNGMIPTVWRPYYKEPTSKQVWPSCMMITIQALMEFSEFMEE